MLARTHDWLDRHVTAADALLAAVLLALSLTGSISDEAVPRAGAVVFSVLLTVPLVWRRRAPVAVCAIVMVVAVVQLAFLEHLVVADVAAVMVALYTVTAFGPDWRLALVAVGCALVGDVLYSLLTPEARSARVGTMLSGAAFLLLAAVWADRRRTHFARLAALRDRARLLAVERDQQATIAAAAERSRIARELHDIIAHSLSVIVTQADGGRYAATTDPGAAQGSLETIAGTAREALAEMRRLLGVLREEGRHGEEPRAPQPRIEQIEELVAEVARAGLPVSMSRHGAERELPGGVQLTLYRIAQEALTNVLKHAGQVGEVQLTLAFARDGVELVVADDGREDPAVARAHADGHGDAGEAVSRAGGHGVRGMRERAKLHGGTLDAGPRPGGGWEVRAWVPSAPTPTGAGR